jgi:regulator of PEP synthase PpsR (kinase-PPPase family)
MFLAAIAAAGLFPLGIRSSSVPPATRTNGPIQRNRLLSLNSAGNRLCRPGFVNGELAFARRLFADNGWAVIDVTRRSIEESALAIVKLYGERLERAAE